jgi:hypothetical protein
VCPDDQRQIFVLGRQLIADFFKIALGKGGDHPLKIIQKRPTIIHTVQNTRVVIFPIFLQMNGLKRVIGSKIELVNCHQILPTPPMLKIFNRKRSSIYVINLYKITDQQTAASFPFDKLLLACIEQVEKMTGLMADCFDLNYGKDYRTLKGFKSALAKLPVVVYAFVGFDPDKTKCHFVADNPMLNFESEKPSNTSLDFSLQVHEKYSSEDKLAELCISLFRQFQFEYGYIQKFPDNFHGSSERKDSKVTSTDHIWPSHSLGLRFGYFKKLYNTNFFNRSHFEDKELRPFIEKYGSYRWVSPDILQWTISDDDITSLNKTPPIRQRTIQWEITENEFLKGEDAKKFNECMKPPADKK